MADDKQKQPKEPLPQYFYWEKLVKDDTYWTLVDDYKNQDLEYGDPTAYKQRVIELRTKLLARCMELAKTVLNSKQYELLTYRKAGVKIETIEAVADTSSVSGKLQNICKKIRQAALFDDIAISIMTELAELNAFDIPLARKHNRAHDYRNHARWKKMYYAATKGTKKARGRPPREAAPASPGNAQSGSGSTDPSAL